MVLQVAADAVEAGLQPVGVGVVVVGVVQDVGQVIVEDVGVQAADLPVVLKEVERSEVRGRVTRLFHPHRLRTKDSLLK